MKYMVSREGQEYGPYSLGDLQRYVASGDILVTDLTRSEGMSDFLPVGAVIGTIAVAPVNAHNPFSLAGPEYPDPPNLHWGLVLLFSVVTFGLFAPGWGITLTLWTKKLNNRKQALILYCIEAACLIALYGAAFVAPSPEAMHPALTLLRICGWFCGLVARFSLKESIEQHYNSEEPVEGVHINGVILFIAGLTSIQYHLNEIVRRKNLDRIDALSF